MNILNRIGKMAEAAWQETAGKLDHHERGSSVIAEAGTALSGGAAANY